MTLSFAQGEHIFDYFRGKERTGLGKSKCLPNNPRSAIRIPQ
jgi:hypothetical protein